MHLDQSAQNVMSSSLLNASRMVCLLAELEIQHTEQLYEKNIRHTNVAYNELRRSWLQSAVLFYYVF